MSYKQQWNEYRKQISVFWMMTTVLIVALVIGLPLAVMYFSAPLYYISLFAVVGAGIGLNIYRFKLSFWICPRCHLPFFRKPGRTGKIFYSYFARQCQNCSLPKWAESDDDRKSQVIT